MVTKGVLAFAAATTLLICASCSRAGSKHTESDAAREPHESGDDATAARVQVEADNRRQCASTDFSAALTACTAVIESALRAGARKDLANAYFNRGTASYQSGVNSPGAITDFDEALALDPDSTDILAARGLASESIHLYADAIDDYSRALTLDPKLAAVWYRRSVAYAEQGNCVAAQSDIEQAKALDPRLSRDLTAVCTPKAPPANAPPKVADQPASPVGRPATPVTESAKPKADTYSNGAGFFQTAAPASHYNVRLELQGFETIEYLKVRSGRHLGALLAASQGTVVSYNRFKDAKGRSGFIQGSVVDATGRPLEGVAVFLTPAR